MSESFLKKHLLENSKTFCLVPWMHIHSSPTGIAAPCCIAKSCTTEDGVGDFKTQGLIEVVNSDKMIRLRKDMIEGIPNPECQTCYAHEQQNVPSFREQFNEEYQEFFGEVMDMTNSDGSLSEFRMRYFDIRFNNICNFKCRTCGSGFSSQWEQEDLKNNVSYAKIVPKNNNKEFLQEVIDQIPYMQTAYFAGGEPLITEEHYILLEEMIRQGKTDIALRYNTNLSNLKFKDKDLLSMWKYFTNRVDIYASIDHYGERAEYIRHGTDWGTVESNLHIVKETPFIQLQTNTVVSVFNYVTLGDFFQYLLDKKLYKPSDRIYTLYPASSPMHLTAHVLPNHLKEKGKENLESIIKKMKAKRFTPFHVKQLKDTTPWVFAEDTWDTQKDMFCSEVNRLDKIRGESFTKVFPELSELLKVKKTDRKRFFPL